MFRPHGFIRRHAAVFILAALELASGAMAMAKTPNALYIGPIPGLTTSWHPAPTSTSVPLGTTLRLKREVPAGASIRWQGAHEISQHDGWSLAECPLENVGVQVVEVEIVRADGQSFRESCVLHVENVPARAVQVLSIESSVAPVALDPENLNASTYRYYRQPSIAALRQVAANRYRTSVGRTLDLHAVVAPSGFAPLMEWRVRGDRRSSQTFFGSSVSLSFGEPGTYSVRLGGGRRLREVTFEIYRTHITSHLNRRAVIPDGVPVTFTAATEPPGLEADITWLASTSFGSSNPVMGQGATFTVRFDDTFRRRRAARHFTQWLGVRADDAAFGQDQKVACPRPRPTPTGELSSPPRVDPPRFPEIPAQSRAEALPPGARALFPAFEGEGFVVTLPAGRAEQLSARQVFSEVVAPILRAVGVQGPERRMGVPDHDGKEMPKASLAPLASFTCQEAARLKQASADLICGAMQHGAGSPEVDRLFLNGEGMTFAQFRADIERLEVEYFFPQLESNVPIEHTGILAARWEGETVTLVTGRAFNRYTVTNRVILTPEEAALRVRTALGGIEGLCFPRRTAPERIELILLPYGGSGGVPALRYAYRMPVVAEWQLVDGLFYVWMDAESGAILQLVPLIHEDVAASGRTFRRAPDLLPVTDLTPFRVDDSAGGLYRLQLSGVFARLDRFGDGVFDDGEVEIPDDADGSSETFAHFDHAPFNDAANAVCQSGGNTTFEQVDLLATLYRQRSMALSAGLFTPFPTGAMNLDYELGDGSFCTALGSPAGISFQLCPGFIDAACPDGANHVSVMHDHTYVAHEFGHALTPRQYTDRPADWCAPPTLEGAPPMACPVPLDPGASFHDFADSWAHAFESTNCWSGWKSKNQTDADASLNCVAHHSEGGSSPRLSQVNVPFDPASPGDHFPEHRVMATGGYADMQIAGAALWALRQGMRSKCLPSGTPQYLVRFVRALRTTGWFGGVAPDSSDRGIYRGLVDLAVKITNQWATSGSPGGPPAFFHNGPHTTSKATGAFARAGIFLIPWQCLDGNTATTDPLQCPAGENGGEAVVDIDDNDTGDDVKLDGVVHPEWDWLERGGPAPTFLIWTGPRYRFSGDTASFTDPSPCNTQFQVEVANDEAFTLNFMASGFQVVDLDPTDAGTPECYGTWSVPAAAWETLDDDDRIYYRVRTRDAAGLNERLSTLPGNGLFTVPPPYAVVNVSGTP